MFLVICYFGIALLIGWPSMAFAEYRAFELKIAKIDNPEEFKTIITSLDPVQYRGYYFVQKDEHVSYTRSWMCHGRTGNYRPVCDPPEAREPAAEADMGTAPTSVEKTTTP